MKGQEAWRKGGYDLVFLSWICGSAGASRDPKRTGNALTQSLLKYGYQGVVYSVNPSEDEILAAKVLSKWGLRLCCFHIRRIVASLSPWAFAIWIGASRYSLQDACFPKTVPGKILDSKSLAR